MAQDPGNDFNLDMVIFSEHIISPFQNKFPETYKLMQYNLFGTLKMLKSSNIMTKQHVWETTAADHEGSDNFRTWAEYKEMIEKNLQQIPGLSDIRMDPARDKISEIIHKRYYKRFPYWPPAGQSQSDTIYITCSGTHEAKKADREYQVTWSCEGSVEVTDKTDSKLFGFWKRFTCDIQGAPMFNILYFDLNKLLTLEGDLKNDGDNRKYKKLVDKLNNKETEAEQLRKQLKSLMIANDVQSD